MHERTEYTARQLPIITIPILRRGKKITCPGARDKLNFRQDKHIFSPNVRGTSEKFSARLFDNIFRTS